MADEGTNLGGEEEDEADLAEALAERDIRTRVARVLAAFHGKQTEITNAGRENTRTVNRLAKIVTIRHLKTDKTFRHNISRYHAEALEEDILIGARREGEGVWTLVAELASRQA